MNAPTLVLLTLLIVAARAVHVRRRLKGWESLWRYVSGPVTVELRRHTMLAKFSSDSLEFPQPREFRVLSMRLAGLPIWSRQFIVSLPPQLESRIDEVCADEFDNLFADGFQAHPSRLTMRALLAG